MPDTHEHEQADVLECLAKTGALLGELADGPQYKAELADELGVTKTTVYNWASELVDYGLVERTQEGYRLRSLGRLHMEYYLGSPSVSTQLYELEPLLRSIPDGTMPPIEMLLDADVTMSAKSDPQKPLDVATERIESHDQFVAVSPVLNTQVFNIVVEYLTSDSLECEVVMERSVLRKVFQNHCERFVELFERGCLSMSVTRQPIPYAVVLLGDGPAEVLLVTTTEYGHFSTCVRSSNPVALEWARELSEAYHESATQLPPSIQRSLTLLNDSERV